MEFSMSRRLSRIGQGVGPYLKPSFISRLKRDEITSLNLHYNSLEDLKVQDCSSKADEPTETGEIERLPYPELGSVIETNELKLLVDLDVSSNKLGGNFYHDVRKSNRIAAEVMDKEENDVGEKGGCGVSLLLLAPNLKKVNLSANALSSQDLDRIFQPLLMCSPLRKLHCLNLSFNELRSLPECFHTACPNLCSLIIVGNFISNFSCFVKSLYPIRETLAIIMVQESDKTSPNPICAFPLYRERMLRLLPFLQLVDGEKVSEPEKSAAAVKVETFIFEQHITGKADISYTQPKAKLKEKAACYTSAVLRVKERVSNDRNAVKRKGGASIERGLMPLLSAPVATLCSHRANNGKTSSKRVDELELNIQQLRVAVEDQAKSTKSLTKAERHTIDGRNKDEDNDVIDKQQENDRFLVHQESQFNEKNYFRISNQDSQAQTECIFCINSEVQTTAHPMSKTYMAEGRQSAFNLLHWIRKGITTRRMMEDALRSLSFQLWRSNTIALKWKEQVQKMQRHCKKVSLEGKKLKDFFMECQENLHLSEKQKGELQEQFSHLLIELKEQKQKSLICDKNFASLLDELKEAENERAQSTVSINHMQSRLESIEKQRVEEHDRAEGLLVTLCDYKFKCSSLQSEIKEEESKRAYLDLDLRRMQSKLESIEMQRIEEYERAEGLSVRLGDCMMKCSSLQSERNAAQQLVEKIKNSYDTRIKEIEQEHQDSFKRTLEDTIKHYEKELSLIREKLLKSKHCERLRRAANNRLYEKNEQVTREKEGLECKCEKLIYSQNHLNTKLVEARNKIQKMTASSGVNNDQVRKEGRTREKAFKRVLKENQIRFSLLEAELAEKNEALHLCKIELQRQLCSFEEKESSLRREHEKELMKMQQEEEKKSRDLERRMRCLEEECATADQRRSRTEVEVNSCKQELIVESNARLMAEEEVKRLTRLLDDQVSRTKAAVQGLLLQTGIYSS